MLCEEGKEATGCWVLWLAYPSTLWWTGILS